MNLSVFKTTLVAAAISFAIAEPAAAAVFDTATGNVLGLGGTITSTAANANKVGWTGNAALTNDAWGMQGGWLSFQLTSTTDTVVTASANVASDMAPAFTIYRTDASWVPFGTGATGTNWLVPGQTAAGKDPVTLQPINTASGAIHKFSQVAQAGQNGIIWGTNNTPGGQGVVETLGYVNSGVSTTANSFGQAVNYGANDVSIDNLYESGVFGTVGTGLASLKLNSLKAGWYTIFVSGANGALAGSPINVSVAAVPVPGAVWLFGSAIMGFLGMSRRKLNA
jgi:hypothetical protein